jgi:hypothetical protein
MYKPHRNQEQQFETWADLFAAVVLAEPEQERYNADHASQQRGDHDGCRHGLRPLASDARRDPHPETGRADCQDECREYKFGATRPIHPAFGPPSEVCVKHNARNAGEHDARHCIE